MTAQNEEFDDAAGASGEDAIEGLFAYYVDRLNQGERLDANKIFAENPAHAAELMELLREFIAVADDGAAATVLGDYTLRRRIGRGGMGVVYDAWQTSLDRRVALKVLPAGIAADEKSFHRFVREAKTVAKLTHSNIVSVYGMGIEANTPYFAMELVEGETLARIVSRLRDGPADAPTPFGVTQEDRDYFVRVARAFADTADGLQYAHSKGVIHRDMKPSNLILDRECHLRILDFGLARVEGQESITVSGDRIGTVQYMSPEQAAAHRVPIDHRTDIYSLGATLYELLTMRPPFKGKDHRDTLSQILEREPQPLRALNFRIPRDLETIVLKSLRKNPNNRYGTAEALGQDLRRFVRGDAIEARPQTHWERASAGVWRHRKIAGVAALVVVLGFIGFATSTILITRAHGAAMREREEAMRQRDVRSRDRYNSDMRRAIEDWESGNIYRFEQLLERHLPSADDQDRRGWEWYYLNSLRRQPLRSIKVDAGGVLWVAWHPDGRRVATGSMSGAVCVWDATTGKKENEFRVGLPPACIVSWSPDGSRVGALSRDCILKVWDAAAGTEVFTAEPLTKASAEITRAATWTPLALSGAWSPDGNYFAASIGDHERPNSAVLTMWDARTGRVLKTVQVAGAAIMSNIAWSPDGSLLAGALREGDVVLWEAATWTERHRFRASDVGWMYSLAWSPDGARLATGRLDGQIALWSSATWERIAVFQKEREYVLSIAWSPDGQRLAYASHASTIRLLEVDKEGGKTVALRGHSKGVTRVAWSPDGCELASASFDGTVRLWDSTQADARLNVEGAHPAVFSPDGRWLACAAVPQGRTIRIFDVGTWKPVASVECEKGTENLAFSPDGAFLAVGMWSDLVAVWQWQRGEKVHQVARRAARSEDWYWAAAAWSPDGGRLVTGHRDGTLLVWDSAKWHLIREIQAHGEDVISAVWSPDGALLATTSPEQEVKVWDTGTWQVVWKVMRSPLPFGTEASRQGILAWSPDGSRLAAGSGGLAPGIVIFDASNGDELLRLPISCSMVAWSPDGKRLATVYDSQTTTVFDPETGDELLVLRSNAWSILSLGWHRDGRRLLAADLVVGVRIWDARKGYED